MGSLLRALCCAFISLVISDSALGHAGHDHGPQPDSAGDQSGPIQLSPQSIANLGIKTVEAELTDRQSSVELLAQVAPLPERVFQVTAGFEGNVDRILVKLGEKVERNQPLLVLAPRLIGNPAVTVRSRIDGVVNEMNATLGQAFDPATSLMTVVDDQEVLVRGVGFENPELFKIKSGDRAAVRFDLYPEEIFEGVVQRVDAGLQAATKTYDVYVLVKNEGGRLKPNMLGTLFVNRGPAESVLAIPRRAVLGEVGNLFAFVREGEVFEKRSVTLGKRFGDAVEILDGVLPGEQVVVQGNYQLQYATSTQPKKKAEAEEKEHGATHEHDHHHEEQGLIPPWGWGLGGFLLGAIAAGLFIPRK